MVFLQPAYLYLALVLPVLWFFPRGEKDSKHAALRTLVFLFLILGLARPVRVLNEAPAVHVFVLDDSASAREVRHTNTLDDLRAAAQGLPTEAKVHLVVFGSEQTQGAELLAAFDAVQSLPDSQLGSPIGDALQAAAALIPREAPGSITLISDGLSTDERWLDAVRSIQERGLPIHSLQHERPSTDVYPVSLGATGSLRVGESTRVVAEIVGEGARLNLRLNGPGGELAKVQDVLCDGRVRVALEFEPKQPGFLPLTLEVQVTEGSNARTDNDTFTTTVAVNDPLRVLYLGQRMQGGDRSLGQLVGTGFEVEAWKGQSLNRDLLANYDLAVLDDLPAEVLGESSQAALVEAVRDAGLGLFACGGVSSFGPGGYHDQPLADVLPVEFVQKEEKRDPSTTLVLIIDTSGSMGGNRVQLAKEVARLSIRRLLPHDKVGIVEFYGAKHWAAPIQPASNAIEIERALNRLDAGGGTVILPAIEEAFYGLKNVQTRYKHVVVLTDGGVESGAFEPLLRNMADDGINISTVLIGPEAHSEFLVTLANWGKGRFYSVPNRFNLPEILLKQPASAKLPSYRPGEHLVQARGGAGWWGDVDLKQLPHLAGYVETRDRPGAEVLLETVEGGHPILGSWRFGLGRVTAFTSEPSGPGTEPWQAWQGFGPWMARVMERTASDQRSPYAMQITRDDMQVVFSAQRQLPNAPALNVLVLGDAESGGESLRLFERAPGHFEGRLSASPFEAVRMLAQVGPAAGSQQLRLVSPASEGLAHEHQVDPALGVDLEALAEATGGEALAEATGGEALADATAGSPPRAGTLRDFTPSVGGGSAPVTISRVWPWFVLLALLTYLLEIFYRRSGLRPVA